MARKILATKEVALSQDIKKGKVKETKITIPAEFVDKLKINPEIHKIRWTLTKEGEDFSLEGKLIENVKEKD